jgi:hypothetical protein
MKRKHLFGIAALAAMGILLTACPTGDGGGDGGGGVTTPVTTTTVFANADTELTISQTTAKSARALANGSGTYVLKKGSPLVTISEGAAAISGGGVTVKFTPSTKGQQSFSVTITGGQMAAFTIPVSGGSITISGLTEAGAGGGSGVYVAGYYQDSSGIDTACYWKNGVRTDLAVPAGYEGSALSIAVSGGDVYVAGAYTDNISGSRACYWKNGTRTDLPVGGSAWSIAVSGGDVYIAGYYYDGSTETACYWKNGTRTDLAVPAGDEGFAESIAVSGGDAYVAGRYRDSSGIDTACYWKNGTRTDLAVPCSLSYAYSIAVSGGDVYVAGRYRDSSTWTACYWKNGVKTDLPGSAGTGNAIAVVE